MRCLRLQGDRVCHLFGEIKQKVIDKGGGVWYSVKACEGHMCNKQSIHSHLTTIGSVSVQIIKFFFVQTGKTI
jgi:predicted acyltransferase (DUF342 family)